MDYATAFTTVIQTYGVDVLDNRFRTLCLLSDYIGADVRDNEAMAFFLLSEEGPVHRAIQGKALAQAKDLLKERMRKVKGFPPRALIQSVEPLLLWMYPNEYHCITPRQNAVVQLPKRHPKMEAEKPKIEYTPPVNPAKVQPVQQPNKPAKPRKRKTPSFIDIGISGICESLTICYGAGQNLELLNKAGQDVLSQTIYSIVSKRLNMTLDDDDESYRLLLPKRSYRKISVFTSAHSFELVGDFLGTKLEVQDLDVSLTMGTAYIWQSGDRLSLTGGGPVFARTDASMAQIASKRGNITAIFDGSGGGSYSLAAEHGDITLSLPGVKRSKLKPTNQGFLHRSGTLCTTAYRKNQPIRISAATNGGKIKIH